MCVSLRRSRPAMQRHTGFEMMRSEWTAEAKSEGVGLGVQHVNSQSDWSWWHCNGRRYSEYKCVFVCAHGLDSVTGGPSSLIFRFVQMKQTNQRHVSMSLLCLSAQSGKRYFLWLTSRRNFTGTNRLLSGSQSQSVAFCSADVSQKPSRRKCVLCYVSATWLLSLSNCSQRPRVASLA